MLSACKTCKLRMERHTIGKLEKISMVTSELKRELFKSWYWKQFKWLNILLIALSLTNSEADANDYLYSICRLRNACHKQPNEHLLVNYFSFETQFEPKKTVSPFIVARKLKEQKNSKLMINYFLIKSNENWFFALNFSFCSRFASSLLL